LVVGRVDGVKVGLLVGDFGALEGFTDGRLVGVLEGFIEGRLVGAVGRREGEVGSLDGELGRLVGAVGLIDGRVIGTAVGFVEGRIVGVLVGFFDGLVGTRDGRREGCAVTGFRVMPLRGLPDGMADG